MPSPAAPSVSSWALRPGDLPSAAILRRERLLRGLANNPVFRVAICARRRRAWADPLAIGAFLALVHGAIFIGFLQFPKIVEDAWWWGMWGICSSAIYMMILFHGGAAFAQGTKSAFHRAMAPPFVDDLALAGHPPMDSAIGLWGAMASRRRRRALDAWAAGVVAAIWSLAFIAPWRLTAMTMAALAVAAYHLAAGNTGARVHLGAAALLLRARREQLDPEKPRRFGRPQEPPRPTSFLRVAIPLYVPAAGLIYALANGLGFFLDDLALPDPFLLCALASGVGGLVGGARGALVRDDANRRLAEMTKLIGEIQKWSQAEAWRRSEASSPWMNMPRMVGPGGPIQRPPGRPVPLGSQRPRRGPPPRKRPGKS